MPWWTLNGDNGQTTTTTNTLLYPPKIVTLTSTQDIQGGEIAAAPEELTTVLNLLSILTLLTIVLFAIHIVIPNYRTHIKTILTILPLIILILISLLFYIAMAQITEIGVGGIIGSGNLDITIPGITIKESIKCSWGLSIGYYLTALTLTLHLLFLIYERITQPPIKTSKIGLQSFKRMLHR